MSRETAVKVTYTNNRGNSICLTERPYYMDVEPIFDYKWSYTDKDKGSGSAIKAFYKDIQEKTLNLIINGATMKERNTAIDNLNNVIEADIYDGQIGKITIGSWYCYGYITATENTDWQYNSPVVQLAVTLVNERQSWYTVLKRTSWGNAVKADASAWDKQYEPSYLYDYDYTNGAGSQLVLINPSVNASEFVLTIQGAASSPYLQVGDNVYHITTDVPAGAVLVIDSTKKTAIMTLVDGTEVNVFSARDSAYYLFATIASGSNPVVYDGSFLWQLDVIEERSEPRWLTV